MKRLFTVPVIIATACWLLFTGCNRSNEKELYYDATLEPGKITASGYEETSTLECCVIFKAGLLSRYVGWEIVAIKLFNPTVNHRISYEPLVYEAEAGAKSPGDIVSQNAEPAEIDAGTWKTITLDSPVTIEASKDYWAGYSVVAIPGIDILAQGAKADYKNNRISFGGISFQPSAGNFLIRIVLRKN